MALTSAATLTRAAERWHDKLAIVDGATELTFGELTQRVEQLAKAFIAAGIALGDRFAIWAPNSTAWQVTALAGQMAGAALVPINTRYKAAEAEDIINRSGCRAVFYATEFLGVRYGDELNTTHLPEVQHRVAIEAIDQWQPNEITQAQLEARAQQVQADALADVLYTSGTTGAPKGVMCTHEQNARVFDAWANGVTLNEADRYLIINPYFHSFGYKAGWFAALRQGATIYPKATFDLDDCLDTIQRERITFLPGAPTIFQSLLSHPNRADYNTSSLRCAVTGAASVPVQLVKDMKHILSFDEVYTAYGLTESTGVVSLCRPGDDFETIATTSGRPMDGIEVQITDPAGNPLAADAQGEIWVRGFNVMQGYLDNPTATAETITSDGWLRTGDVGLLTQAGYLRITDRLKDMYICGGFNCYPAEIENVLLSHPAIADVAVLGYPDERMGEVGHAFIVLSEGAELSPESLITWAREKMANYKVPRKVSVVDELPRNASGKVQKFLLQE